MYSRQQGVLILAQQESRLCFISDDGTHVIYLSPTLGTSKQRDYSCSFVEKNKKTL